jgi:hypothetical protein
MKWQRSVGLYTCVHEREPGGKFVQNYTKDRDFAFGGPRSGRSKIDN